MKITDRPFTEQTAESIFEIPDERGQSPEQGAVVSCVAHLISHSAHDTIHRATCMLEYLTELDSECTAESVPNSSSDVQYGRWLTMTTITQLIRHGLQQNAKVLA